MIQLMSITEGIVIIITMVGTTIAIVTMIVVIVTVIGTEETIMVDTGMIITTMMDTAVKLLFVDLWNLKIG